MNEERRRERRRANWYRDIWLFLISCVVLLALWSIQKSREDLIRGACVAQNAHHDDTIKAITAEVQALPPKRRAEAEGRLAATFLIIDALAPHKDCDAAVRAVSLW